VEIHTHVVLVYAIVFENMVPHLAVIPERYRWDVVVRVAVGEYSSYIPVANIYAVRRVNHLYISDYHTAGIRHGYTGVAMRKVPTAQITSTVGKAPTAIYAYAINDNVLRGNNPECPVGMKISAMIQRQPLVLGLSLVLWTYVGHVSMEYGRP
jgi:hypothetical protein